MLKTKIVATLGPSTNDHQSLTNIVKAGVNVVRVNMSHGSHEEHENRIKLIRQVALEQNANIAIMADLQGPKIRVACFIEQRVLLEPGQTIILDPDFDKKMGTAEIVGLDYKELANDLTVDDILLLDDGKLRFKVIKIVDNKVHCEVIVGGKLSNNKGINKLGGGLTAEPITEKDLIDVKFACEKKLDWIALSFVRKGEDVKRLRDIISSYGHDAFIVSKIERKESLDYLDGIINESDALMVARGDLAVEIGFSALPGAQKKIIQRARELSKAVITATQMMESMIESTIPTRAEVLDVANSVLDGTDAVMLSAESATGRHPDKVVASMTEICINAESNIDEKHMVVNKKMITNRVDEAISLSAIFAAELLNISAVVAVTQSGSTPVWMSRSISSIPIFAVSKDQNTCNRLAMYRGVHPINIDFPTEDINSFTESVVSFLQANSYINKGEKILLTFGEELGVKGSANSIKIIEI